MSEGIERKASPPGAGIATRRAAARLHEALLTADRRGRRARRDHRPGLRRAAAGPRLLRPRDRRPGLRRGPGQGRAARSGARATSGTSPTRRSARCASGRFEATVDFRRLDEPDVVIICVPTPLTESREPDLTYVVNSTRSIAERLRPGQLVVLESTTYPGTTREVVLPLLAAGGLEPGVDFFLAFSPEREDPGNPQFSAPTIPKVVGGLDPASLELAVALYGKVVVRVVPVSSPEVAEACKILENTYRAINIALVNELKIIYSRMGIDVWEVIEAAKTKPFGFQAFYPGPGLGGHCIPIDPFYLTWVARKHGLTTRFIELAGEINTSMPAYVVSRVADALNDRCKPVKGSKITAAGHGLQEGRRRPARVARLRADGAPAAEGGGGRVQRPAHPHPAVDAPLPRPAHVQPGADRASTCDRATAC